jgi:cellulose synthase/poly-beta-1,6-N-acetylglucosamine synthase-like glycosyltransferase
VTLADFLWAIVSIAVLLPVAVLFTQTAATLLPRRNAPQLSYRQPTVGILVPAHNEGRAIAETLRSLRAQLGGGDRLLVVADNCADDTACVAAAEGAEVIERKDSTRRGKGYALDYGVRHFAARPPEVVIVVDADCTVGPGVVQRLAGLARAHARPVQARYEMAAAPDSGLRTRIATFAWIVKNYVRPLGMRRLGLPCQLMGTGMALPWSALRSVSLASGQIVEDVELGLQLARTGAAPLFCPDVSVSSTFPATAAGLGEQRVRWEHGHLGLMTSAPGLLLQGLLRGDAGLMALALDLCVPPLALLLLAVGALTVSAAVLPGAGADFALSAGSIALAALACAVFVAWLRHGRHVLPFVDLARVPLYVLWKLPIYLRFVTARESRWIRTRRDGE